MPLHTSKKPGIFAEKLNIMLNLKLMVRVLTGGMPNALKEEVECQNNTNDKVLTIKNGGIYV